MEETRFEITLAGRAVSERNRSQLASGEVDARLGWTVGTVDDSNIGSEVDEAGTEAGWDREKGEKDDAFDVFMT